MFEGVPNYPDFSRFWQVIDKHDVTVFYTAPTAIRALMREGDGPVKQTSPASLRPLGSVGAPINPEAWRWDPAGLRDGTPPLGDTSGPPETRATISAPPPRTPPPT